LKNLVLALCEREACHVPVCGEIDRAGALPGGTETQPWVLLPSSPSSYYFRNWDTRPYRDHRTAACRYREPAEVLLSKWLIYFSLAEFGRLKSTGSNLWMILKWPIPGSGYDPAWSN